MTASPSVRPLETNERNGFDDRSLAIHREPYDDEEEEEDREEAGRVIISSEGEFIDEAATSREKIEPRRLGRSTVEGSIKFVSNRKSMSRRWLR